jgi:pyridoxal phosphate enzyme (YggS family)
VQITIIEHILSVRERIAVAAGRAGRSPEEITLVGVSKRHPAEAVRAAWEAGVREFGENYVQEAREKRAALEDLVGLRWHLIGGLQSNKARLAVSLFDTVQTVDRLSLAQALSLEAERNQKELSVLVEVNLTGSAIRAGVAESETQALCEQVAALPCLRLKGLMGMAPLCENAEGARPHFSRLRDLFEALPGENRQVLSMGMSGDFEAAIAEGATLVRIGTALFGERPPRN